MTENPEIWFFLFLRDDYNFCFENILFRLRICKALKCLQAMRPIAFQKLSHNWVNSDKVLNISLYVLCLKCIVQIMFCMFFMYCHCKTKKSVLFKHFLKVLSKSDITIMNNCKLQIEILKFVHSSCCFTISELVFSDQLTPTRISFGPTYSRQQSFGP